jgi:hypothetical protein
MGPTLPGGDWRTFARDGAISNSAGPVALSPGHPLQRDDCPVHVIQLPAKTHNQEVNVNFAEHLPLPGRPRGYRFPASAIQHLIRPDYLEPRSDQTKKL